MASTIIPTNQIAKIQTNKKLIAFYDKLHIASIEHYAQIHAKGESDQTNTKVSSLIGISIQDYSNGTGQNNIITQFNLAPEQVQFLLTRIEAGFQDFGWSSDKIFGTPDTNGYSIAQKFVITRHSFKQDGTVLNNPWYISISNGHGIRVQNHTGGYYMKGGSYQQEKSVFINLNDMDLYGLLKRTDAYIRNWEMVNAYQPILQGQQTSDSKTNKDRLRVILKKTLHILVISTSNDQVIIMVKVSISTQNHNISIIILIIRGTHHE